MIAELLKRLSGAHTTDPLPHEDARIALAALMVRVARTDGNYSPEEKARIDNVLIETYAITEAEAAGLRTDAETAESQAADTVRFTRLIKDAVPYEHRKDVVEALWRVAATDGINADEHGLLRLVANLVGVSDVDSGLARQRALKRSES